MIEFEVIEGTNIIEFVVDGKVTREELKKLTDACEGVIADHGKVRMLKQVRTEQTPSIALDALWDNLKFGFRNMKNVERVAGVADKSWMGTITKMADPFFSAELRFFPTEEIDAARAWLREEA